MLVERVINTAANTTLAISALGLLVHIFGDPNNKVWDNKIKAYLAKVGLSITTCGAITNAFSLDSPRVSEVLLNCGLSITFFWLSWWQFELFKEAQEARLKRLHAEVKKKSSLAVKKFPRKKVETPRSTRS